MAGWTERAACRRQDPEMFFPISEGPAFQLEIEEAKAVCAGCPVSVDCYEWAFTQGEPDGIWGGTTPEERRALRQSVLVQSAADQAIEDHIGDTFIADPADRIAYTAQHCPDYVQAVEHALEAS